MMYDSLSKPHLTSSVERQLVQLYGSASSDDDDSLLVSLMPMQQQLGSSDCGIFVIAAEILTAVGHDFGSFAFDQSQMRGHLIQCFEEKALSPFPRTSKRVRHSKLSHFLIHINCSCGRPDSVDQMVQCDTCDAWFHFECAHLQGVPEGDWFCTNCISLVYHYNYCIIF